MSKSLDREVWEVLGFGDGWFPPDVPLRGPDWGELAILTILCLLPGKYDWIHPEIFPPVSRDWNLAMWAAEKAGLFYTDDMNPPHALFMLRGGWEIAEVTLAHEIFRCLHARSEIGPTAICKAILAHLKEEANV